MCVVLPRRNASPPLIFLHLILFPILLWRIEIYYLYGSGNPDTVLNLSFYLLQPVNQILWNQQYFPVFRDIFIRYRYDKICYTECKCRDHYGNLLWFTSLNEIFKEVCGEMQRTNTSILLLCFQVSSRGQVVDAGTKTSSSFSLTPTVSWSPEACVTVYCILSDGEVTSDTVHIPINQHNYVL